MGRTMLTQIILTTLQILQFPKADKDGQSIHIDFGVWEAVDCNSVSPPRKFIPGEEYFYIKQRKDLPGTYQYVIKKNLEIGSTLAGCNVIDNTWRSYGKAVLPLASDVPLRIIVPVRVYARYFIK